MIAYICAGKRPTRPANAGLNQRLQRPVWNVITAGWSGEQEKRCELSAMHLVFSASIQWEQEIRDAKGDSNTQYDRNPVIAEMSQTLK